MTTKRTSQHEPEVLAANAAASLRGSSVRGVQLISRSGSHDELAEMGRMIRALPDSLVLYVRSILSAEGFYIVHLGACPRTIVREIGSSLERASGCHNGILIESPGVGHLEISAVWRQLDGPRRNP